LRTVSIAELMPRAAELVDCSRWTAPQKADSDSENSRNLGRMWKCSLAQPVGGVALPGTL